MYIDNYVKPIFIIRFLLSQTLKIGTMKNYYDTDIGEM